eukprot:scaffold39124_cov44-Prasinocladus_malaysianus.AAC.1
MRRFRQALKEQRAKTRAGTTANSVEHQEALEASAVVGQLADAVENEVNNLLADSVMTTGKVVGGILLAGDKLLGVEELAVGAGADLVNDGRLKVDKDRAGDVLASTSLGEEGVESVISATDGLVRGHLAIGLQDENLCK